MRMTDVHFVLMGLDTSAGMCLITKQIGIRVLTDRKTQPPGDR